MGVKAEYVPLIDVDNGPPPYHPSKGEHGPLV